MRAPTRMFRSLTRRPFRFFAAVLALSLIVAAADRWIATWRGRRVGPGHGAAWIWMSSDGHPHRDGEPVAFYAVRDFEVRRPVEALAGCRLVVVADEEYVAYLNGRWVGADSGQFEGTTDRADLYDVGDLLESGWNRIVVELRSSRGAGGMLASLRLGDETLLASDARWRIFRRYVPGILRGWRLAGGEPAIVWDLPPTGRWRLREEGELRPRPDLFPPALVPQAVRARYPFAAAKWSPMSKSKRYPARFPGLGAQSVVDFGREVEGYLYLELRSRAGEPALVYYLLEPVERPDRPADEVILPVPGSARWLSARLRRFRYLLLLGAEPEHPPEVWPVEPGLAARLASPPREPRGAFGIPVPPARPHLEEDVLRRLDRVADRPE